MISSPLVGLFAAVGLQMLGLIAHYMWAIPKGVANRVKVIATATGANEGDVSTAVHIAKLEPFDLEASLAAHPVIVCPGSCCMNPACGAKASNGAIELLDDSGTVYGINGRRHAHIYGFTCSSCCAVTGVSTVTLQDRRQFPRPDFGQAEHYVMNRKLNQNKGQIVFENKLLNSFFFDFATVKTIESWCKTYNYTHGLVGTDKALHLEEISSLKASLASLSLELPAAVPLLQISRR